MHRFIAIFLFAISTCLSLRASIPDDRVKLPDFAYPQDVIKTATELIKSRLADERVLGALELWNAERLVDYGSLAKSIKRLDSLANSDSDPAVKALLKLMGAEIGRNIRWNRSIVNNYMNNQ